VKCGAYGTVSETRSAYEILVENSIQDNITLRMDLREREREREKVRLG
jgi:hypothetical protein